MIISETVQELEKLRHIDFCDILNIVKRNISCRIEEVEFHERNRSHFFSNLRG
jgi:hypothetical protein